MVTKFLSYSVKIQFSQQSIEKTTSSLPKIQTDNMPNVLILKPSAFHQQFVEIKTSQVTQ